MFNVLDIDECGASSPVCDINANCSNTRGTYICTCRAGYTGDGKTCQGRYGQCMTSCLGLYFCHRNFLKPAGKQPTLSDATSCFPQNCVWGTSAEIRIMCYSCKSNLTNQKHYPDQGCDASSVWNFFASFLDVIWRVKRWKRRQMWAVFSGNFLGRCKCIQIF